MQIQVNTDHNIEGREKLAHWVSDTVQDALNHFNEHITRVEVHLSDVNSNKKGGDKDIRCMMEARIKGRQPIAVSHSAADLDPAVNGAADKLSRAVDSALGKLQQRHHRGAQDLADQQD